VIVALQKNSSLVQKMKFPVHTFRKVVLTPLYVQQIVYTCKQSLSSFSASRTWINLQIFQKFTHNMTFITVLCMRTPLMRYCRVVPITCMLPHSAFAADANQSINEIKNTLRALSSPLSLSIVSDTNIFSCWYLLFKFWIATCTTWLRS